MEDGKSTSQAVGIEKVHNTFIGSQKCESCHASEFNDWMKSDHYHAMAVAIDSTVEADFNNTVFHSNGFTYHFYRRNGEYMVRTAGHDGKEHDYKIAYTFGWKPLQQYLVRFPKGKYQALTVAWDTNKKRWFSLYPNQKLKPDDWLSWKHGAMNWNTMCADCHSTNLKQNYIASSDSFHTTWSEINVSCEACHGPGQKHVVYIESLHGQKPDMAELQKGLQMNPGIASHKLVDDCARCHSLREQLTNVNQHDGHFMDSYNPKLPHPDSYFADGQIKGEDYVYGSFLQSKMYHFGIACTNCHDPHTMHVKAIGNNLCISCHDEKVYDTQEHHHHKMNTDAALCVNCHMPGKYYMQVDFRRDHSFRIPRPDLTEKYGTPNACNDCHKDKSAKWADKEIKSWNATPKDHFFAFTQILAKAGNKGQNAEPELMNLVRDHSQPAIARATAIWYLGQFLDGNNVSVIQNELHSPYPMIRVSAVNALSNLPASMKMQELQSMVQDSIRAVRVAAAKALADVSVLNISTDNRDAFKRAQEDLQKSFYASQYFPVGQLNQGEYYEKKKDWNKAITAYQKALEKDHYFNQARINLAYLYDQLGEDGKAEPLLKTVIEQEPDFGPAYFSMALLISQKGDLKMALPYFRKASDKMPDNARVVYNEAIVYQKLKRYKESEKAYLRAIKIDPNNVDYQYGICTLYMQQKLYKQALPHVQQMVNQQPNNLQFVRLLQTVKSEIK